MQIAMMHSTKLQQPILILSNVPDKETATRIARELVDSRAAACVNILQGIHSVYRWEGKTEEAAEIPLLVKTTADRYDEIEAMIKRLHPYDVPEIIALSVTDGLPAYLQWLVTETRKNVDV